MRATSTKIGAFLIAALLLAGSFGCAPKYQPGGPDAEAGSVPELNDEAIRAGVNDVRVYEIKPESGTGDPITWRFDPDEPKEITVVDKQVDGTKATIVLDIKTRSSMRANILRNLAGQIRTQWELRTGMVLRRWEIVRTENISMTYKDVPKPSPSPTPQNANQ